MQVVIEAGFGHLFGANAEPGALIFFRRAGAMKFERTLHEAFRILKPQGRIAFTDWVAHRPLSEADRKLMWQDMAVTDLYSLQAYGELIRAAGFIPNPIDQNPWAHWRSPMDMMRQGWSTSLFHAAQQWSTRSS